MEYEDKHYLLLARSSDGYIHQKVSVFCGLDKAVTFTTLMMASSPRLVRGEIIDGNRTHVGDFSVKPCLYIYRDQMGEYSTEKTEKRPQ